MSTMEIKEGTSNEIVQFKSDNEINFQLDLVTLKIQGVWQCKVCGITAGKRGHIRYHAEIHIGGISRPCHICSKTFSTRKNLNSHISKNHTGIFICDICEMAGMNRAAYNKHQRNYHKK